MGTSKILIDGVGIDLTSDTVASDKMLDGIKGHDANGNIVTGNIPSKSSSDLVVSEATITVPEGYYPSAVSKTVASGTAGTPIATKSAVSNHAITVTPSVINTTGYITGDTKTGTSVSVVASELVGGTLNINTNGETDVTNYQKVNVNVSGSEKVIQYYSGYARVASTSYTTTAVSLTVGQTGTYKVSWIGFRQSNSGTNGSQLYIGNTAYGSAQTAFTDTYAQKVALSNVNLTAGQKITVRARSRSTSYGMFVGNLIIEKTA